MQITKAEVIPVELKLRHPVRMARFSLINHITAVFVRIETRQGQSAWGCTVADPNLSGDDLAAWFRQFQECAALAPDLNPLNLAYSLHELALRIPNLTPGIQCAFDLAFHDLLSLSAGLPLYRVLGGYRSRIQTSVTIPIAPVAETVDLAKQRASCGFRILKIKGGLDPEEDVRRVRAVRQALPEHILRLDADEGYTVQQAIDVARALEHILEMFEQPTPAGDLTGLHQVKQASPLPVLADQSVRGPASALEIANRHIADGMCIKLVTCGGLRSAQQIDAIARAAQLTTMVSCTIEPALLVSAGLSLALSSPAVRYGDLDGHLDLVDDPSRAGFRLENGWLIASDVTGMGYTVELD
jgi:L-alanine-DL-glutamate epimerase-like enolase superfamily enzyme